MCVRTWLNKSYIGKNSDLKTCVVKFGIYNLHKCILSVDLGTLSVMSVAGFWCKLFVCVLVKHSLLDLKDFFIIGPPPPLSTRIHSSYCSLQSPCSLCLCSSAALVQNTVTCGIQGGPSSLLREHNKRRLFLHLFMTLSFCLCLSLFK